MLRLLLDEHVSPRVARGLRRGYAHLFVYAMTEWREGCLLGQDDEFCLTEANDHKLTLVTYDRRTFPPLLKRWIEEGRSHSGVIFVDDRTISPSDVGGLVRALTRLVKEVHAWDWTDRIIFLQR